MSNDKIERASTNRRTFIRGAAALGAGATLAPYLGRAGIVGATTVPAGGDATNPFGIAENSTVDAVIFNGGYGIEYVEFAANIFEQTHEGSTVEVSPATLIAPELQPRFVGGNPPDLIDNSGAQQIGMATILDQLEDLTDVIDAPNLEGTPIRDTLFAGVLDPGTFEGKLAAINYALTVYAVWYSGSLFEANGWTPPTTWAEALELGAAAAEQDKYLFCFGQEAATYYQTLSIDSAIKEGGDEVRLALENLAEGCWSLPAVQGVFAGLKAIIDAGYMQPGGAGTQFIQAQAQWSNDQSAILYPSGSWIENEMKDQFAEDFQLKGVPTPYVTADAVMPTALHSTSGEPFIVPSQGANVAGGKELLRIMLSTEAATNFTRTNLAPTIVAGLVPEDGFGSTALQSQGAMLDAAGVENIFSHKFIDFYGTNQEQLVIWQGFLAGDSSVEELTASLQEITDRIREDDSITKIVVE